MKKNLIVLQDGNKNCGAAALLSVIRYYGGDISLDRLTDMLNITRDGTNFYDMSMIARKFNIVAKCFKADGVEDIKNISVPFIVHMNNKNYTHFVVVYKISNNRVIVMDPAKGKCIIDMFDFSSMWTGYIMLFEKINDIPKYGNENVLNRIIKSVLVNNISMIIFLVILSIIFTILSCIVSLYSQIVFDHVIDTTINNLIVITIVFSILFIVKNITSFIRNHLVIYLNQKLDVSIMLETYSKVILLPYTFYKNRTTGDVLSRINDLSYLKNFICKIIISIFLDFLMFIVSFIIVYCISSKILLLVLFISFLYFIVIVIFNSIIRRNTSLNQENISSVNNMIIESVSGFETIKGLNVEDNMILKFSRLYTRLLNNLYYSEKVNNIVLILKNLITDIGMFIINFVVIKMIMDNKLTIGNYMTISFLGCYLIYPIKNLIEVLNEYHFVKSTVNRGNDLLCCGVDELYKKSDMVVNGNINIKNLNFTFNNKYYVLNNITFNIKEGERVLILGESGSGKSTIMKILYKYYMVDRGYIYLNGYDINDYSVSDIRSKITYISQNEMLFSGTIRENILLDRNVSQIDFLNICNIVMVDEIIKNNLLGYDYLVQEGGVNLSGGQRQRIILARSLLKDSNFVMIDEGLNQIDIKMEREILSNIFNYFYDKTFIVISHRKENIDLYDKVINVSNGQIDKIEERVRNVRYR